MIVRVTAIIIDLTFVNRFGLSSYIDIAIILRIRDFFTNDERKTTEIIAAFFAINTTHIMPITDASIVGLLIINQAKWTSIIAIRTETRWLAKWI